MQHMNDSISLNPHQHLVLSLFSFILNFLMGMSLVLVFISRMMARDIGKILIYLLAIYISFWVKYLFMSFWPFSNWIFFFSEVEFESSLYILDTSPLLDMCFANIFSQSVAHLSILLTGSFTD